MIWRYSSRVLRCNTSNCRQSPRFFAWDFVYNLRDKRKVHNFYINLQTDVKYNYLVRRLIFFHCLQRDIPDTKGIRAKLSAQEH